MQALRNTVVGTDFSPCSERALDAAITYAIHGLTRITLIHVCELSVERGMPEAIATAAMDEDLMGSARRQLDQWCARRKSSGIEVVGVLRSGKPWEKINNVAAEVGAGLIVIGRHGACGGRSSFEVGRVGERVVRTARRPVLIVSCDLADELRAEAP
jgi:nucleotide-binding universal stress UspA family protein